MKKIGLFMLSIVSIFFIGNLTHANSEYEYTNLDIVANILEDGSINITEDFTANFFVQKHGIIRTIPINYSVGGKNFHIEVSNIHVQGKNFTTSKSDGERHIKIGDADRTLVGEQDYPISYSTYGLIRNFSGMGYAELYRNVVGNKFDTNINRIRAELILPKLYTGFTADDFLITTDGKSKTIDGFEGTVDWSEGDRIIITYNKGLHARQGITLAVKFPNGYFEFDHDRQSKLSGDTGAGNSEFDDSIFEIMLTIIIFTPFILILILVIFLIKLLGNQGMGVKKEFREKYPVIVQYDPPKGLNSAEVGILFHRYEDPKDVLSLVYKWAYEGIIKIKSGKGKFDFSLIKTKDISEEYPEYERNLFYKLFAEDKIELNDKTSLYVGLEYCGLEKYGIDRGRFISKERKGCNIIGCLFMLIIMGCFFFSPVGFVVFSILWCIGCFGWQTFFRKTLDETEEGAQLISHILGYRKFLKSCDENMLRTLLKQDPLYFDKVLPYAVVFGLDTKLIKKIKPIMKEMNISPTRYDGNIDSFSRATNTINSMAYNSHHSSSSSYSSDSGRDSGSSFDSGGSDFDSGGGGGGGGGSSW